MSNPFAIETLDEFYEQVVEFRRLCQDRSVMRDPERRGNLAKGLGVIYIRMDLPEDDMLKATPAFEAAMSEFTMRVSLIEMPGSR